MKVNLITNSPCNFKADKNSIDNDGNYKDPLMSWPLRGAAFTNEVGEALRPVIGNYATLSWAPALLYIGADIYDKYKNNQTEYSPNSKRGLKQAIFQGSASILLPLIAVKAGQNLFSQFGKFAEDKVTYNVKENVSKLAENFIANGQMHAFAGREEDCVKTFVDRVKNQLDFNEQEVASKNPFKKLWIKIEEGTNKIFKYNHDLRVERYSEKVIKELIDLRKNLLNPKGEFKNSKEYIEYKEALKQGMTENVAIKSVLNKFQQKNMLKGKIVKTIGGFIALGLAIQPIDRFVEETLIGKYVGPQIDNLKTKNIKS